MSLHPRPTTSPEPPPTAPMTLSVESVVLHGLALDRAGAERVRTALAAELTAHLSAVGYTAFERAVGGPLSVRLGASDSPEAIARALARGLTGSESSHGGPPCRSQ